MYVNLFVSRDKLDLVINSESGGVSKHLGQIADSMDAWEGAISERLDLTQADVAAIKTKYRIAGNFRWC